MAGTVAEGGRDGKMDRSGYGNARAGQERDQAFSRLLRTDFRLCADCVNGLVNAMIQGSVLSMCRSADEFLGVLVALPNGMGKA